MDTNGSLGRRGTRGRSAALAVLAAAFATLFSVVALQPGPSGDASAPARAAVAAGGPAARTTGLAARARLPVATGAQPAAAGPRALEDRLARPRSRHEVLVLDRSTGRPVIGAAVWFARSPPVSCAATPRRWLAADPVPALPCEPPPADAARTDERGLASLPEPGEGVWIAACEGGAYGMAPAIAARAPSVVHLAREHLTIQVVDAAGAPCGGIPLDLEPSSPSTLAWRFALGASAADGTLALAATSGLPARVAALGGGPARIVADLVAAAVSATPLALADPPSGPLTISIPPLGRLCVVVVDAAGMPLSGAEVLVAGAPAAGAFDDAAFLSRCHAATTDARGHAIFPRVAVGTNLVVRVRAGANAVTATAAGPRAAGDVARLTVVDGAPRVRVRARLRDPLGRAVAGADARLCYEDSGPRSAVAACAEDGTVAWLLPGSLAGRVLEGEVELLDGGARTGRVAHLPARTLAGAAEHDAGELVLAPRPCFARVTVRNGDGTQLPDDLVVVAERLVAIGDPAWDPRGPAALPQWQPLPHAEIRRARDGTVAVHGRAPRGALRLRVSRCAASAEAFVPLVPGDGGIVRLTWEPAASGMRREQAGRLAVAHDSR